MDFVVSTLFSTETMLVVRAVVPSFIIAFVGFALARFDSALSQKTVSNLIYYVFSPCLIFSSLYKRTFSAHEFGILSFAVVALIAGMMAVAFFMKRREKVKESGYYLPVVFMSTGTISLPIALFLYGNEGLAKAVMFHMVNITLLYSFGVWLVSGTFEFKQLFKIPALWATILGITVASFSFETSNSSREIFWLLSKGIDVIGMGAIPLIIISFGYSLSETKLSDLRAGVMGGGGRIIIGPVMAFALVYFMRWTGMTPLDPGYDILENLDLRTTEAIIILNASMPGPIMAYLLNVKFDSCPKLAVSILAVGSIGGLITIPVVLTIINSLILK